MLDSEEIGQARRKKAIGNLTRAADHLTLEEVKMKMKVKVKRRGKERLRGKRKTKNKEEKKVCTYRRSLSNFN